MKSKPEGKIDLGKRGILSTNKFIQAYGSDKGATYEFAKRDILKAALPILIDLYHDMAQKYYEGEISAPKATEVLDYIENLLKEDEN